MKRSKTSDPAAPKAPIPRGFWVLLTTLVIDMVGFGIVIPVQPFWAKHFDASPLLIGLIGGSFSFAQFLLAPVWGRISDRVGRRPVLLISLTGTAIGFFITGSASSLWMLFAGRLIDGASGATIGVTQAAVSDLASPRERPRLMGLMGAAFGIGFVLGPAIGGVLAHVSYRLPFFVAGTAAVINLIATYIRLPETKTTTAPPRANLMKVWRIPNVSRLAVVVFISVASFSAFENTFGLFGERRLHLGPLGVGMWLAFVGILLVVVQGGLIRPLSHKYEVSTLLRSGLLLTAAGLVVFGFTYGSGLMIVATVLISCGQGVYGPSISSTSAAIAPADRRGEVMGATQSVSSIARIVGPATGGFLFGHVSIGSPYFVGAAGLVVALVCIAGLRTSEHSASEKTPAGKSPNVVTHG